MNTQLKGLYREKLELKQPRNDWGSIGNDEIFSVIAQAHAGKKKQAAGIKLETLQGLLHDAMIQVIMQPQQGADLRRMVADYIGIDLATEWRLTEEYLQKKTTAEILALGEKLGIWADKKAGDFLYETLGGKRGKFDKCKKSELIRIILESGVDLAGKVPDEILR